MYLAAYAQVRQSQGQPCDRSHFRKKSRLCLAAYMHVFDDQGAPRVRARIRRCMFPTLTAWLQVKRYFPRREAVFLVLSICEYALRFENGLGVLCKLDVLAGLGISSGLSSSLSGILSVEAL